jgi:predicted DNA-binding antitoxin AbrB/MazE fold protein
MAITVEATYENGTLKLSQPLPLREQEKVQVTVHTQTSTPVEGYGIMGWTGSVEDLDYLIEDVDNDPLERP